MAPPGIAKPWRRAGAGLILAVRLTPKSAKDAIEGVDSFDGRAVLKARVRAAPEKGKANAALEKLVAKWLGVPKTAVSLVSGSTSRLKSVDVAGDADALAERIGDLLDEHRE